MSAEDLTTQPTVETILTRIDDFRRSVEHRFENVEERFNARFDKSDRDLRNFREEIQERLDDIEKQAVVIRKDQLVMRMDLRSLHEEPRVHLPALE